MINIKGKAYYLQVIKEFQDILEHINSDKDINVVILEGAGGNFSAGAELDAKGVLKGLNFSSNSSSGSAALAGQLQQRFQLMRQPVHRHEV